MAGLVRRKPKPAAEPDDEELMPLAQAAEVLCWDESTLRQSKGGTAHLTRVRQGTGQRQRIFFLAAEVYAHRRSLIEQARALQQKTLRLITEEEESAA